jgi:hypothetical protein
MEVIRKYFQKLGFAYQVSDKYSWADNWKINITVRDFDGIQKNVTINFGDKNNRIVTARIKSQAKIVEFIKKELEVYGYAKT